MNNVVEKPKQKRKMTYRIKWVVNEYRKDKRTGVINPGKRDPYTQMLMDEAEEFFRQSPKEGRDN